MRLFDIYLNKSQNKLKCDLNVFYLLKDKETLIKFFESTKDFIFLRNALKVELLLFKKEKYLFIDDMFTKFLSSYNEYLLNEIKRFYEQKLLVSNLEERYRALLALINYADKFKIKVDYVDYETGSSIYNLNFVYNMEVPINFTFKEECIGKALLDLSSLLKKYDFALSVYAKDSEIEYNIEKEKILKVYVYSEIEKVIDERLDLRKKIKLVSRLVLLKDAKFRELEYLNKIEKILL